MAEQIRSGTYKLPPAMAQSQKNKQAVYIGAGVASAVAVVGILLLASHKPPDPYPTVNTEHTKTTPVSTPPVTTSPVTTSPVTTPTAVDENQPAPSTGAVEKTVTAPPKKNDGPPPLPQKSPNTPNQTAAVNPRPAVTQPPPPAPKAETQCTMKPFDYSNWHDVKSGDMVWTGNLPTGGDGEIPYRAGSTNRAKGEILEPGYP